MAASGKNKDAVFNAFTEKARKRIQEKKVRKYRTLYIPSLDENIKIRNLDYQEFLECNSIEEGDDPHKSDKYATYLAVVEPDLTALATTLKASGEIVEYTDITDIFDLIEISSIAMEVMKLSGYVGSKKVVVVDELKN